MFEDRTDAGEHLAAAMRERGVVPDVVLAVPRGGLPVARAVADAFGVPLDIVAAKKIGAPGNPELALGAVAADGSRWLNDDLVARLNVDEQYLAEESERAAETARQKIERYRRDRDPPDLAERRVAVVDDGVATGATARACLRAVRNAGAGEIVLAVPVGPPDAVDDLRDEADEVVIVETPAGFTAVGASYRRFDQVSDEEAVSYLDRQ